ncbi:MAG: nitroreductase family deazaflavin-dependent oxidoreductase [Chloroflexi bacterium]|nr:nitroreductase family deazaflavin-dependent oxidoreductase [Chloroflexota bacterium]MCY3581790.1 nitroreductase family deazaflavin-dependent oxidoreductase [Chloroflexota bacterium]MCY3717162.1 nitroreductase family deazaflavin-dependent oxidoreductase [Chloroflexota bacterium]MDE2651618.1 nitroreductase family deazaflavin-dependent oxidoreductase [Chloroflexota bacterium]MXX84136.1 nitroreductase family deazaflavin-dependent oxidoreductase [Chloroflexota bacterium]
MDDANPTREFVQTLSRAPLLLYQLGWGPALDWLPLLALTTRKCQTGAPRYTALEYRRHGSKLYLVCGLGEATDWYQDIEAAPGVTIQQGASIYAARAVRVADPAEALRALYAFSRNSFVYESLFARMSSANAADLNTLTEVAAEFTVVRIEPSDDALELPPVPLFSQPARQLATVAALLLCLRLAQLVLRAFFGAGSRR